jgi:hypothetical protein
LAEAARNNWLCVFCHDGDTPSGYIKDRDGKLIFEPEPW